MGEYSMLSVLQQLWCCLGFLILFEVDSVDKKDDVVCPPVSLTLPANYAGEQGHVA